MKMNHRSASMTMRSVVTNNNSIDNSKNQQRSADYRQDLVDHSDPMYKKRNSNKSSGFSQAPTHVSSLPDTSYMMMNNNHRSASIPISNSIRRTSSETQLSQDEAEADYKDFLFYSRVVHGISSKQRFLQNGYLKYETQMCLNSIVNTRHADMYKQQDFDWEDQLAELGFVEGNYPHQDPALQHQHGFHHESSDDGIFALDL